MTLAEILGIPFVMLAAVFVIASACEKPERRLWLDDPDVRPDERTEGVVERLRRRGGA